MTRVAFLIMLTLAACCPLTGNAAAWSFATKRPEDAALAGTYRADWILSASDDSWKCGQIELLSDGTAKVIDFPIISSEYGVYSTPKEPATFSGEGRWKVDEENTGDTTYFNVVITIDGGDNTVKVWHNAPPHELWIQVGDEDSGEGVLFRHVH